VCFELVGWYKWRVGMAKRWMEEQDAQGWSFTDSFVCWRCVDEPVLRGTLLAQETPEQECSFCGISPAAPLGALLGPFVKGLRRRYDRAGDELPWDGREGGYQGDTIDTWDLVGEFDDVLVGDGLLDAVRDAIDDEVWVAKDWAIPAVDEQLTKAWDRFCEAVKFETRYVMWRKPAEVDHREPGEIDPSRVLDAIGDLVDIFHEYLTTEVEPATPLWRARPHGPGDDVGSATELGTTPVDKSQANRMSPAGIPMFYGAYDPDTAIAEATEGKGDPLVTVGAFHVAATAKLLDLTHLKPVPSIFADDGDERGKWQFLHHFERSLRVRAAKDQIDYVPTQIVTEYFLRIFGGGRYFDGIQYTSDVVAGRTCIVLNVRNEACLDHPGDAAGRDDLTPIFHGAWAGRRAASSPVLIGDCGFGV
jgi:hypothetical protein